MIFIGGIHGVGKSYFCEQITEQTGLKAYSASKLITEIKHEQFKSDKLIADIGGNQNYLLDAVGKISDKEYLLDGHFCLLNSAGEVERVPLDTFKQLHINAIMVIYDDVSKVVERLNTRDGIKHREVTFEKFQNEELSYAEEIAEFLCVPFTSTKSESDIVDAVKQINKWFKI
ncbi:MAG: ATP-binding protein [Bacillota bacterium]|nr:ATP-binding protein [Bacillota bacterium]